MRHTMMYPQHPMLDDLVQQFFGDAFVNPKANSKYPLTDVYDEDGIAYMEIAVAGFSKDEITIIVDGETITIKGIKNAEDATLMKKRNYIKQDIAKRNFEKSYNLMFEVEDVDATFNNGILKIKIIPRISSQKEAIQIKIK